MEMTKASNERKCVFVNVYQEKRATNCHFHTKLKGSYYYSVKLKDRSVIFLRTAGRKSMMLWSKIFLRSIYTSSRKISSIVLNHIRRRSRILQSHPVRKTINRGEQFFNCKPTLSTSNLPHRRRSRGSQFHMCKCLNQSLSARCTHIHRRMKVRFHGSSRLSFPSWSINHRSIDLGIHWRQLHL